MHPLYMAMATSEELPAWRNHSSVWPSSRGKNSR